ncbi:MAG: hypothetical protein AAFQ07_13470 [Chloroflexota bacterium]
MNTQKCAGNLSPSTRDSLRGAGADYHVQSLAITKLPRQHVGHDPATVIKVRFPE